MDLEEDRLQEFGAGQMTEDDINGFIDAYDNAKNKAEYLKNYLKEKEINTEEKTENLKNALNAEYKKREDYNQTDISSGEKKKIVERAKNAYEAVNNYQKTTYGSGGGQTSGGTSSNGQTGSQEGTGSGINLGGLENIYRPGHDGTYEKVGGRIIGVTSFICYAAAIIILIVKGVGFMKKAPEAKAEAKKELVSYAVGTFILFGAGAIINLIGGIALNNLFK